MLTSSVILDAYNIYVKLTAMTATDAFLCKDWEMGELTSSSVKKILFALPF